MAYDLRFEDWIPFRRQDGTVQWGAPFLLTDDIDANPVVGIAALRPDFAGALTEFLIGLFSLALAAVDEDEWLDLWNHPPSPEILRAKLAALPAAFDLDSAGPRFLQDFAPNDLPTEGSDIETLLIDAAGGQTTKLNKDLFIKRARVSTLGRPAAAMALLTLQTYAPSGGQGHRTSMRGGGPLTTLIEPRVNKNGESDAHRQPLWKLIWANAETVEQWRERGPDMADALPKSVFPWLAATRTSDTKAKGHSTTPQDVHPMQAYFGMPRRIRVDFTPAGNCVCDLTGKSDDVAAKSFRSRNYGVEYDAWRHPLSPYYKDAKGQLLPTHGQPGGFCWRDWAGLLYADPDVGNQPAQAVTHFLEKRAQDAGVARPRLCVFGYDMDNMKARGWVQSDQPALTLDQAQTTAVSRLARNLSKAGDAAGSILLMAVKAAKFDRAEDAKGDMSVVKARLWALTEAEFYAAIRQAAEHPDPAAVAALGLGFLAPLVRTAEVLFDEFCPTEGIEFADIRRLVGARHGMMGALRGYGKMGAKLFEALGKAVPEKKPKGKKGAGV